MAFLDAGIPNLRGNEHGTLINSRCIALEKWAQDKDPSQQTLTALHTVLDHLKSRHSPQQATHDPQIDDSLCFLFLEKHDDSQFIKLLQDALPDRLGVFLSSVRTSHAKLSQAIAVATPSRQCLWVMQSSKPQSVLIHPHEHGIEGLLGRMSDREILDELGRIVDNPALGLCAMDLFQWGIDWIPNQRLKSRCFRILRKLAKKHQTVPPSLRIADIEVELKPFSGGGFSDVYHGIVNGGPVCVKVLRFYMTKGHRQRIIKDFCRETLLWRQLRHPNILPFLGFNEELFTPSFCLISPLLVNGNVRSFLESNPHHDRLKVLLDIAKGIGYLHEYHPPIIHGDIRGANVLVKDNLECCLGDLGLSLIAESGGLDTTSRNTQGGACRWMAPELLNSEFSLPNPDRRKRDIYAFGCTCLEICANEAPFSTQPLDYMVCLDVMQGRRPPRPSRDQVSDQLWSLIESCWLDTPLSRPDINLVLSRLRTKRPKPHSSDEKETSNPIASGNPSHSGQGPEDDTNSVVVSDRLWVQSALPLHVSRSDIPDCHRQKAELGAFGEPAVLNSPMRDQLLLFLRERAKRWMQVRHQNVIEVLGIDESSNAPKVFMITDATYFDNILSFNYANPHERTVKRLHENLMDIANGLHALHQHGIVHADLRCENIVYRPSAGGGLRCILAKFDIMAFAEAGLTILYPGYREDSLEWTAPEIVEKAIGFESRPQQATELTYRLSFRYERPRDIYAFACTAVELFSGRRPFADPFYPGGSRDSLKTEIARGVRPIQPLIPSHLWQILKDCFKRTPEDRPSAGNLAHRWNADLDISSSRETVLYPDKFDSAGDDAWTGDRARKGSLIIRKITDSFL